MSQDQQQFEALCRLLVIKRHEQPPPGYFNNFSREVIAQIKAGQQASANSFFARLREQWFGSAEGNPLLAGACGVVACGVLLAGLVYFEMPESGHLEGMAVIAQPAAQAPTPVMLVSSPSAEQVPAAMPLLGTAPNADSTGGAPSLSASPVSLFGPVSGSAQPVSFGGN